MMGRFVGSVIRVLLGASVFILCSTTGEGIHNTFTGLSLLGYHLCNYTVTNHVTKTVAYQKSYEKQIPCGGWIPWRLCSKIDYKEEYHTVTVPESLNLTDCCAGYEQVGLYCVLPLNRSSQFASRCGTCPAKQVGTSNVSCTFDMDCPGHTKCCETSQGNECLDPVPEEHTVIKSWYKVSVLVKMNFDEINRVDPRFLNHLRLLHSMMDGALRPLNFSMYHLQTTQGEPYTETSASQILLGLQQRVPLETVSSLLRDIMKRVYEIVNIVVQDVANSDLGMPKHPLKNRNIFPLVTNSTPASQNTQGAVDSECHSAAIINHRIFNVTSSSFEVSWRINSTRNYTFQIEVYKEEEFIQRYETTDMKQDVFGLEAGIMYTVKISYNACAQHIVSYRNVKTEVMIFGVTLRILNYNFTDQFLNSSSNEYQNFSSSLMTVIQNSFPSNMLALYKIGKLKVHIYSIKAGSIIVTLKIIIEDSQFPKDLSAIDLMFSLLHQNSMFHLDLQSSAVNDWDECASRAENDCGRYAECINTMGSYICRCKTTTDDNPSRPGRNCEGEIVDPLTEMIPTFESNVTEGLPVTSAPSLSGAEIRTATSFMSIALSSSGTQESSTPLANKTLPASLSTSGFVSNNNNNTLNISETPALMTKEWNGITAPNETLTAQELHNSSVFTLLAILNTTSNASVRNRYFVETSSTPSLLPVPTSPLSVTEHPKPHVPNNNLDIEIETENSSWPETKSSALLLSSSEGHSVSNTTIAFLATECALPLPVERIVLSNVTSTSFHVVWASDFMQNSTFEFLLFEGEKLIQEIKSQSSNLAISGLEPGILYTVVIKTELCGKKSKPVQQKVKTAAQQFSVTVRITNLKYSSEFGNSSSKEYQNFTQLFFNEIRTALPLNVLQKMDAGMIKMVIMSVTNGSIVVNFSLMIATDLDASNISKSFLDALLHSPNFVVDNDRLSINALPPIHDDTQREDWNSNVLPLTSPYTSATVPSPAKGNSSVARARSLANATTRTTVINITTETILNIHSSPQVSSLTLNKPTQEISMKKVVGVLCEIEKIVITIQKSFLQQKSIPESSLYLGEPRCNVSSNNYSHVILQTGWNECGTEVQSNTTHTIAKTILRNDVSSLDVIHHLNIVSPIHCVFQNNLLTSSGYTPEGMYTIFEDLHGSGHFLTEMQLFIGRSPIPQNFSVSASDDVIIEVGIQTEDSSLKVVVSECWATPTNNSTDPQTFPFIQDSCAVPNTYTDLISNGVSRKAKFKLKIFSFVNNSVVYLHCKTHVCVEITLSTCKMKCNGVRSVRIGETIPMPSTSWGPLRRSNAVEAQKRGLGVGYILLIVIGTLVLILGIAGLLVFQYQRKTAAYNFKIKSENFSYQVFYE